MDLTSFIIGLFCGGFSLHVLYLTYFHMFILGRIEKGIVETRVWLDGHINLSSSQPFSAFSLFEQFNTHRDSI
jgi:hypothetical protein